MHVVSEYLLEYTKKKLKKKANGIDKAYHFKSLLLVRSNISFVLLKFDKSNYSLLKKM